jgi:hypothetical protein
MMIVFFSLHLALPLKNRFEVSEIFKEYRNMNKRIIVIALSLLTFQPILASATRLELKESHSAATITAGPEEKSMKANSDPTYSQLRSAKLSGEYATVENLVLNRDTAVITFKEGQIFFLSPVEGKVTGAVFIGTGEFKLNPVMTIEQRHLGVLTGSPTISEPFGKMVLRFTDSTYEEIKKEAGIKSGAVDSSASNALEDNRSLLRRGKVVNSFSVALDLLKYNLDARILMDLTRQGGGGLFHAYFVGKRFGDMMFGIDPLGAPFVTPEEVVLASFNETGHGIWTASHIKEHYRTPGVFDENHQLVDLEHHNIKATVRGKRLDATVETRFKALTGGSRVLPFDLFPRLRVSKVSDGQGRELGFIQEDKNEDGGLYVILADPLKKDEQYTLTFQYGGDDAVSDSGGGNFTLDARSNWYPNSAFGDRATFEMTLITPKDLIMVATGQPMGETKEGDLIVSRWKSDVPLAVAGFNYGKFKKNAVVDEKTKYTFESYANKDIPDYLKDIQRTVEQLENEGYKTATTLGSLNTVSMMDKARAEAQLSIGLYSELYGPLPYGRVAMTQQPYFNFGQAWPMLVYMPLTAYLDSTHKHQLGMDADSSFFKIVGPHEVAHQWWGHVIGWKSYRDQWMSEGFAHFSAAMFAQVVYKNDLFVKFWKEQREAITNKNRQGKRPADVGSVYMGYRLNTPKTGSIAQAMIYPKGAFILHMLRMMMWEPKTGDQRFSAMMKDFVKTHYNSNVSTQDFQRVAEKHMTKDMDLDGNGLMNWFFGEWVFGTNIPEYKFDYEILPADGGKFKLVGKVTQSRVDDSFKMRVPIYLDFDGKITRLGAISIYGNTTTDQFEVILPKKPKRAFLCYYEDVLCITDSR